jgi:hypothetical protein
MTAPTTTFTTTLLSTGGAHVGIEIPDEVLASLGRGKRVPVKVTLNGYTYRSTTAVMGGRNLVGLSGAHRAAAGVAGGEQHEVTLEVDTEPRTVELPEDLAEALAAAGARDAFDALAPSARREHVRQVVEAKAEATRQRRLAKIVDSLRQG